MKNKNFSIYIANDNSLKYTLIIGEPMNQYIYKPEQNKILWIQSFVNNKLLD